MKEHLKGTLSMSELLEAVKAMKPGKSLGQDGVILEFYKIYWDLIRFDYLAMLSEGYWSGRLHPWMTQGLIFSFAQRGRQIEAH